MDRAKRLIWVRGFPPFSQEKAKRMGHGGSCGLMDRSKRLSWGSVVPTPCCEKDGARRCVRDSALRAWGGGLVLDTALGEDAFLVGVFDFAHLGYGVGDVD